MWFQAITRWAGGSPKNGELLFSQDWMGQEEAYNKGIELIMQDPRHNICKITWWWSLTGGGYTLKCWRAPDDTPLALEMQTGNHVLFYSEMFFRWKDRLPR